MQELEVICRTRGNFCAEMGPPVAKLLPKNMGRIAKIPVG